MKKEIVKAYETMKPDAAAKERMLANILAAASEAQETGKETHMKKSKTMRKLQLAASLALVLAVPVATAYAADLFGLRSASIGKFTVEDPVSEEKEREINIISLQGMSDSPESKACAEWFSFYMEYDKDGTILSEIGNGPTGIDENYRYAYNCYTQEMVDKVDELCKKYQLSILTGRDTADTCQQLCSRTGIGDVCGGTSKGVDNSAAGGYFYDDGTLHFEGTLTVNEPLPYVVDYQFSRAVKGSFSSYSMNAGDIDDYEEWEYTMANGDTVLLANSASNALILADKEESFIVVSLIIDMSENTAGIDRQSLERLADAFDFSSVK